MAADQIHDGQSHVARWSPEEDAVLRACIKDGLSPAELAAVIGRTPAAIRAYAWRQDLRFDACAGAPLRALLRRGGRLLREEVGGAIGVRWGRAHRSGPSFDGQICERLLELGLIVPASDRDGVFASARF